MANKDILNDEDIELLHLPIKELKRLNDFLKSLYNKDGSVKDIPSKKDMDFIKSLSEVEIQRLLNLSDLRFRLGGLNLGKVWKQK